EGRPATGSPGRLTRSADAVFEAAQLLHADRTPRVEPAGGNADLGAEAELAAVGELGRGVVQDDRRIDLREELLRRRRIGGDDGIGMIRAVTLDMGDRLVDAVDHLGGDDRIEILRRPVLLRRGLYPRVACLGGRLAPAL